mgnify:CR=1 FL=1
MPRTGHDPDDSLGAGVYYLFQSTCPVRGTTPSHAAVPAGSCNFNPRAPYGARLHTDNSLYSLHYFNPRAPYGARLPFLCGRGILSAISIHVPRTGHDGFHIPVTHTRTRFQSTCPVRGTTIGIRLQMLQGKISIHVPRTGHDLQRLSYTVCFMKFQSTCPVRGTTVDAGRDLHGEAISIHVPRTGHDVS